MNAMRHPFRFGLGPAGLLNLTTAGAWRDYVRRAEDLGFSSFLIPDTLGPTLAPIPALTAVAVLSAVGALRLLAQT